MSEQSQQRNVSGARVTRRCSGMCLVAAALALGLVWSSACYQPSEEAELSSSLPAPEPSHDWAAGQASSDAGMPGVAAGPTLTFRVQTAPVGGRFAPNNVGAIWIEDDAGRFVRTLELWGRSRSQYLRRFQAAAKGNVLDAVTGATLTTHLEHEVVWDFRAAGADVVPDGAYRLKVELTDKNSAGALLEVPFLKGEESAVIELPDNANFQGVRLSVE